jgi:surface antigen
MRPIASALAAALTLALLPAAPAFADPPPWAPAHGWRKKHDPDYVGYTGQKWPQDYGVIDGRCNAKAVGAVVGGVAGGAVGSQVGKGDTRLVAIIAGTAIGAVLGAKIGHDALELTGERRTVAWTNPTTGVAYRLTPTANLKRGNEPCRAFTTEARSGKKKETLKNVACRRGDGVWELQR